MCHEKRLVIWHNKWTAPLLVKTIVDGWSVCVCVRVCVWCVCVCVCVWCVCVCVCVCVCDLLILRQYDSFCDKPILARTKDEVTAFLIFLDCFEHFFLCLRQVSNFSAPYVPSNGIRSQSNQSKTKDGRQCCCIFAKLPGSNEYIFKKILPCYVQCHNKDIITFSEHEFQLLLFFALNRCNFARGIQKKIWKIKKNKIRLFF